MARRPDPSEFDEALTRDQLQDLERRLVMLSPCKIGSRFASTAISVWSVLAYAK
jgi:hypothetical protein